MLKNDKWIATMGRNGMIVPFESELVRELRFEPNNDTNGLNWGDPIRRVISYGLSSYGYDLRLSSKDFRIFQHIPGTVVDPKNFNENNLYQAQLHKDDNGSYFILPANSYGLGVALEKLDIPADITCLFIGKSTYARCGIIANLTPGEAGWRGHLTLEFSNSSNADCRIYANEGIVQALFFQGEPCDTTYADRSGKYQDQGFSVQVARV